MSYNNPITAKLIIQKNWEPKNEKEEENIVEEAIDKVLQLTHIRLDRCGINKIANLECFTSITNLYLQHNEITVIENLEPLQNLKFLCLSHNKITSLNGLNKFETLAFVDISNNCITHLDVVQLPKNLIILDLRENDCKFETEQIFLHLTKLKQLNGCKREEDSVETDSDDEDEESGSSDDDVDVTKSEEFEEEINSRHQNRMEILNDQLFVLESPRPLSSASHRDENAEKVDPLTLSFHDVKKEIELNVNKLENEMKLVELKMKDMFEIRPDDSSAVAKANYAVDEFITGYHEDERRRLLEHLEEKLKKDMEERKLIVEEYTTTSNTIEENIDDKSASDSQKSYRENSSENRSEGYIIVPRMYKSTSEISLNTKPKPRVRSAGSGRKIISNKKMNQGSGLFSRPLILDGEANIKTPRNKNLRPINYNYKKKTKENLQHFMNLNVASENTEIGIEQRIPMPPIESKRLTILPSSLHKHRSAPVTPVHSVINPRIRTPGARPIDRSLTNVFEIPHG